MAWNYPHRSRWNNGFQLIKKQSLRQVNITISGSYGLTQKYLRTHYNDVIMGTMTSQISSITIVYSTVYSGANQRKHPSFASLAFVHKWPVTRKMFPFDDVIMIISYTAHTKDMMAFVRPLFPFHMFVNLRSILSCLIYRIYHIVCFIYYFLWRWYLNMSPCTASRVNANIS